MWHSDGLWSLKKLSKFNMENNQTPDKPVSLRMSICAELSQTLSHCPALGWQIEATIQTQAKGFVMVQYKYLHGNDATLLECLVMSQTKGSLPLMDIHGYPSKETLRFNVMEFHGNSWTEFSGNGSSWPISSGLPFAPPSDALKHYLRGRLSWSSLGSGGLGIGIMVLGTGS